MNIPSDGHEDAAQERNVLRNVQRWRKFALRAGIGLFGAGFLFTTSAHPGSIYHEVFEFVGLLLIITCILGRSWSILYIGGRKTRELIRLGPYSICRNPLYLFSFMGAFGIGLQSGSLVIGLVCLGLAIAVFVPTVRREEEALARIFGAAFEDYRNSVPRFLPRFKGWHDSELISVAPSTLYRSVRDSLLFVCGYPFFEIVESLQSTGWFPVLLRLY